MKNACGLSFLILNHNGLFLANTRAFLLSEMEFVILNTSPQLSFCYMSGKIKYHDACHGMFALLLIRENWYCICLITNAGLLKIIFNAHVHIQAKVKSKDCKSPISAANVKEKYICFRIKEEFKKGTHLVSSFLSHS